MFADGIEMRFFFHVRVDGRHHHDPEGEAFASLSEARAEAIASARCVLVDLIREGRMVGPADAIEVMDEAGALLLDVPLLSVVVRNSGDGNEQLSIGAGGTATPVQVRPKSRAAP
jgi:hypothetical protein